jgi:hypothetical protein
MLSEAYPSPEGGVNHSGAPSHLRFESKLIERT